MLCTCRLFILKTNDLFSFYHIKRVLSLLHQRNPIPNESQNPASSSVFLNADFDQPIKSNTAVLQHLKTKRLRTHPKRTRTKQKKF